MSINNFLPTTNNLSPNIFCENVVSLILFIHFIVYDATLNSKLNMDFIGWIKHAGQTYVVLNKKFK